MIEEYRLRHNKEPICKTEAERQAARENEDALYDLGFRPIGAEW